MARTSREQVDSLLRHVDLVELVTAVGVKLERRGGKLVGLCPMHSDREPSLVVTPSKKLWSCLGDCGRGGTVVDWVMATQGVSFRHAVEILRKGERPETVVAAKRSSVPRLPCPVSEDARGAELLAEVVAYYHQTLLEAPEARAYLAKRGLDDDEAVEAFRLGFANRTLGLRLPASNRSAGAAMREHLAEVGVIRDTGHEHLNGSLVIPVYDAEGRVVKLYGRKITPNLRAGTPLHLYLPGPHRGVFNLAALRDSRELILCESLIDALTFWCAGFRNVTSSFGTNGFTDEMQEAFMSYGVERVLIAYGRDDAGDRAAAGLAERLGGEGVSCFRVRFPHHMDANEYALKVTPAARSLGVLLRAAEYVSGPLGRLSVARRRLSGNDVQERVNPTTDNRQPVTASPVPPAPASDVEAEVRDHEVVVELGGRRWRVRGLACNLAHEHLCINLLVSCGDRFHVDSLDLYSARQRGAFLKQASEELQLKPDILKKDLGRILLKLEELQDQHIRKQLEPSETAVELSDQEQREAMALLKDPRLLERIGEDLSTCGLVGEHTNKLVAYLAAISRKLARPLAVMVQSSSAAGKSTLMEAVLAFCPEEERVQYSAMTGQSLFYVGEADLKHKVLAIAEEKGAARASYALKLLQSEGKLSIASTGKNPKSGRLVTHEYVVEGPAAILMTTSAIDVDEELLNRCVVLAVDESREQTRAIHQMQRRDHTLEGLERRLARSELVSLHKNAQRLLRPLPVVNPYAERLTFLDDTTRTRRDHLKYLGLIDAVALVHQHQREVKTGVVRGRRVDYVEATLDDIATANQLASEVLGRTLDELPPQTRRLLMLLDEMVAAVCEARAVDRQQHRFSRREVRERTGWGNTQLKLHLSRLVAMEYLLVHRGPRGQGSTYEMLYGGEGKNGSRFVLGLLDADGVGYDGKRSGRQAGGSASGRPLAGGRSRCGRDAQGVDVVEDEPETLSKPPNGAGGGPRQQRAVVVAAALDGSE